MTLKHAWTTAINFAGLFLLWAGCCLALGIALRVAKFFFCVGFGCNT
jgi:hypothetical protein